MINASREGYQHGNKFDYRIENPDGELKRRPFYPVELINVGSTSQRNKTATGWKTRSVARGVGV